MAAECYLFELGFTIVKCEDGLWYERDRKSHEWIASQEWDRRFYDGGYDVIQIEYDEENERIVSRRRISGQWSLDDWKLAEFERDRIDEQWRASCRVGNWRGFL